MNKVILMGRLTRDPETNTTASGHLIARFSIAVDRRTKDGGADFPSIVAFDKRAEFVTKYFKKGMKVAIEGRLQTGSYTNNAGVKIYTTDVIAENVEFAESKKAGEELAVTTEPTDEWLPIPEGIEDTLPFN